MGAKRSGQGGTVAVPYASCMLLVAHLYALPPRVLPAIHHVEGGAPGLVHHNRDNTDDFGVMQVNTRWLVPLARYTHTGVATVRERLTAEPCYNIAAAGAIMRTYLNAEHGDLMRAVGDYHSHTPALNLTYRTLILQAATAMFVSPAGRDGWRPVPARGKERG